jgi:hypothetical protein
MLQAVRKRYRIIEYERRFCAANSVMSGKINPDAGQSSERKRGS